MAKLERSCGKGRQHAAGPGRTRLKRYPIGAEKGNGGEWHLLRRKRQTIVIPAKAGIQHFRPAAKPQQHWIPAFAGMTGLKLVPFGTEVIKRPEKGDVGN